VSRRWAASVWRAAFGAASIAHATGRSVRTAPKAGRRCAWSIAGRLPIHFRRPFFRRRQFQYPHIGVDGRRTGSLSSQLVHARPNIDPRPIPASSRLPKKRQAKDEQHANVPTFEQAARTVHERRRDMWSNGKHVVQWINTLRDHVFPTIGRPIAGNSDLEAVEAPQRERAPSRRLVSPSAHCRRQR